MPGQKGKNKRGRGDGVREENREGRKEISARQTRTEQIDERQRYERRRKAVRGWFESGGEEKRARPAYYVKRAQLFFFARASFSVLPLMSHSKAL